MSIKTLYHGSNQIIEAALYHYAGSNIHNDYGLGFYCTQNLDIAKEWANKNTRMGFANKYRFDDRGLKILDLTDKNKYSVLNWIAILIHNRQLSLADKIEHDDVLKYFEKYYIDITQYDVVIGYRADDAYFRFPLMFIRNVLTYEKLEEIYLNGNLGKQYVLISQKAFKRIKFVTAISVESIYHDRYHQRKSSADNSYKELERLERISKGTRVRDLMDKDYD